MLPLLLATALSWSPVPDSRVVSYQCEAWERAIGNDMSKAGPVRSVPCSVSGPLQQPGDYWANLADHDTTGWVTMFCVRSETATDLSDCQENVTADRAAPPNLSGIGMFYPPDWIPPGQSPLYRICTELSRSK